MQTYEWRGLTVAFSLAQRDPSPGDRGGVVVEDCYLAGVDPIEVNEEFGLDRPHSAELFERHRHDIERAILDDVAQDVADDLIDGDE